MDIEELLRKADFSKHAAAHREALRELLFGTAPESVAARKNAQVRESVQAWKRAQARKSAQARELTLDDLEQVTAAGRTWMDPEKKFPSK